MPRRRGVARRTFARRRIFRIRTKWSPPIIARRFKLLHPWMIPRLKDALDSSVGLEQPTMDELTFKGVPTDQWPYYIGFAKRMLKLYEHFTGSTLADEKLSLINEYENRGYDRDVLEQLQDVVEAYLGITPLRLYCGIGDSIGSWYAQVDLTTFTTDRYIEDLARFLPNSMAIEDTGHYLLVGQDEAGAASIVKIRLSDFTPVATLTLNAGETNLMAICIDGNFLYAVMLTSPAIIVKVNWVTMTRVGALTLNPGENMAMGCCVVGNFLYVTLRIAWAAVVGRIAKINLTTFTRDSVLTLAAGDIRPYFIRHHDGYLYTACNSAPCRVVKVRVSTFTRTAALDFLAGENYGHGMVVVNNDLYVGLDLNPGRIIEVDLTTFLRIRSCIMLAGESNVYNLVYRDGFLYAAMGMTAPSTIVKVDRSTLSRVGLLTPVVASRDAALSLATIL